MRADYLAKWVFGLTALSCLAACESGDPSGPATSTQVEVAALVAAPAETAPPPSGGLGSFANYLMGNSDCSILKDIQVTIAITSPLVASRGFSFQLNANSAAPNDSAQVVWQQYVIGIDGPGTFIGAAINNWDAASLKSGIQVINSPEVSLGPLATPLTIPAGYTLTYTLANDNDGNITGVTWTVNDGHGNTTSQTQILTSPIVGATTAQLAPIVDLELDVVGPGNAQSTDFLAGAGTITYTSSTALNALPAIPSCAGSQATTAETSNSVYGLLPAGPSNTFVQSFGINQPPVAVCRNFATSANASCLGSATAANINGGSSSPAGDALSFSLSPPGPFVLGTTDVTLTVTDPIDEGTSSTCAATVTVVDNTPPVLTAPPNLAVTSCTGSATVEVGQATAGDNCAIGLVPVGAVVAANGVKLVAPIPVVGGQVTLGVGTFTIQWTVSDGTNTSTADQTVVVGAGIQAGDSFLVDDRAQVRNGSGGFASVLSSGTGATRIGNSARTGAILSVGPVTILHQAIVTGNVTSAGTVTPAPDATVTGTTTAHATVVLPPLPALPVFPAPTGGTVTVNSGTSRSLAAGSYTQATVNGGSLILAAGNYFFQILTLNSGSTVRAAPTTRIFVENTLVFNAPILAASGTAPQPVLLGFGGQNLSLATPFNGTLVAPNADVSFGTGAGITYTGSFFGRILEINPASALVCESSGIAPTE